MPSAAFLKSVLQRRVSFGSARLSKAFSCPSAALKVKSVFALSFYRTKGFRIRKDLSLKFDGLPMGDIGAK